VPDGDSTLRDLRSMEDERSGVLGRRIAIALLTLVVVAGATGWLGVRSWTARAEGSGYELTLTYPRVARSGLDVAWNLRLEHPGGFDGPFTIAVSADYFDIF
jgi:hypothetical protein